MGSVYEKWWCGIDREQKKNGESLWHATVKVTLEVFLYDFRM